MFTGLIPDHDKRQKLRIIRSLQAMGGGLIQSLVALFLFFAGGFRLSGTGFVLLMLVFWIGHFAFFLMIRSGFNRRFEDPSLTRGQVFWAIVVILTTIYFMQEYRFLMVPFLPLTIIFGAFKMTSRQFITMAVLIIVGYCAVLWLTYLRYPETIRPVDEILGAAVFVLIVLAFSLVGNEISRLRRRLHQRNVDLEDAMKKMEQMAITDELTGLINRRQMLFMLDQQKAMADRVGANFSICFFDIDHFKSINDTMGHHVGDVVLQRFAVAARNVLRASDLFARFGGEEFVLLATGVGLDGAAIAARRICKTTGAIDFDDIAPDLSFTLSVGVAQFRSKEEIRSILSRADSALYLAKNSGRNCIKLETDG